MPFFSSAKSAHAGQISQSNSQHLITYSTFAWAVHIAVRRWPVFPVNWFFSSWEGHLGRCHLGYSTCSTCCNNRRAQRQSYALVRWCKKHTAWPHVQPGQLICFFLGLLCYWRSTMLRQRFLLGRQAPLVRRRYGQAIRHASANTKPQETQKKRFRVLGVETSADDTCVALLDINTKTGEPKIQWEMKKSCKLREGGIYPLDAVQSHTTK